VNSNMTMNRIIKYLSLFHCFKIQKFKFIFYDFLKNKFILIKYGILYMWRLFFSHTHSAAADTADTTAEGPRNIKGENTTLTHIQIVSRSIFNRIINNNNNYNIIYIERSRAQNTRTVYLTRIIIPNYIISSFQEMDSYTVIEFFSGLGGWARAFQYLRSSSGVNFEISKITLFWNKNNLKKCYYCNYIYI